MRHLCSAKAFTLIELLVAMAVGAVLLVSLMSVLSGSVDVSRKTNDALLGSNAAAAALDLIGTDLESLAVSAQPGFEYLHAIDEAVGDTNAIKLIMLTSSANDTSTSADDSGQVRAVVYRLAYQRVVNSNKIYGIYRTVDTNAGNVFKNYLGANDLSTTALFTAAAPPVSDFLAGNIVDFRVRFYPSGSLTALNTNAADPARINGTNIIVGGASKNTNVAAAEVSLTYLEETGAKLLQSGAMSLDRAKDRYGYKVSKRVLLRSPVSP